MSALSDQLLVATILTYLVAMVCYAVSHEAHHRGQIAHWCRELGVPITAEQSLVMWEWDKLHKQVNRLV